MGPAVPLPVRSHRQLAQGPDPQHARAGHDHHGASELAAHLRARGIVDIGAYRGVGANQLRIGTWPSVEVEDVEALLACIDYCLERVL